MDTGHEHGRKGGRGGKSRPATGRHPLSQYGNAAWTPVMIRRTPPKPARQATAYRGDITPLVQSRGLDRHTHQDSSQTSSLPYMSGRLQFNLYHGRHLPIVWHNERKWAP
ncbi:hypothetical protein BO79DRAFT_234608 [Aspergillus costaricaensis CBS 115574]|uniref:Uncharacterized protein n=1 Tax=Aspergillus costaricaensis CBS 115574 TaxID=1448317 RepID=A0ACD1IT84_9EURO|nr:hypothetical protein BO79DRAFT_234608 [Aspergillus costaricaensis CBS 115574]RAK93623.1 hypothetical protein BO79DRAFT_234608 [Aspergillus costaricaensis CBS 115574]